MRRDGDDDNGQGQPKKQSSTDPVEPAEIDAPQEVDVILGSESDKKENKKFL